MATPWTDNRTLLMIEEYRRHTCLWDPADDYHKSSLKKNQAWFDIATVLESNVAEVKRKMASLLASFRRERKRGGESHWYAFNHLSFLLEKFNHRSSAAKGSEEEDSTEWWTEHNGIIDDPDLINLQDLDDKSEIQIDSKENIPVESISANAFAATYDNLQSTSRRSFPPPRKRARYERSVEEDLSHKVTVRPKSVTELFVDYLAAKLDTYNEHERNIVQHKINEVLFQADMGNFKKAPYEQNGNS